MSETTPAARADLTKDRVFSSDCRTSFMTRNCSRMEAICNACSTTLPLTLN